MEGPMGTDRLHWDWFGQASAGIAMAIVTAATVAACGSSGGGGGGGDNGDGGTGSAKQEFVSTVYPAIQPTCAKCHASGDRGAPVFLAANADGSYNALEGSPGLIAAPTSSPLVQHGLHSGPALTEDQNNIVAKWLTDEANARNLGGDTGKPPNLRAAFKAFGACMDYDRWTALKLDTIADTQTDGSGQCKSCHIAGQADVWLSDNHADSFNHFTKFPYVQRLVVGTVTPAGAFDTITNSRRLIDKGTEAQQAQSNSHPRFSLPSDIAANLTQFVQETISNMNANRCQSVHRPDAGADGG
jgi:hypothetical protein